MTMLSTAIVPPSVAPGFVYRPRLDDYLDAVAKTKVTLVQAPAGFGKTTLLQQWQKGLLQRGMPVSWISLDRHIRNILEYVIEGLKKCDPEISRLLHQAFDKLSRDDPGFLTTEQELGVIVSVLADYDKPIAFIFDEAQSIHPEESALFRRFVNRLPVKARLILASRTKPDIPVSRMKGRGELLELGMQHLRFTRTEAGQLLKASNERKLTQKDIDGLFDRTEGWATGLRLASLSMTGQTDRATLIASFSGSKSVVADFFSEDVVGSLPLDVQQFLLATCFMERLSADLCNAVTGRDDSAEMLKWVEAAGLFLIRMDDEANWYRYHSLFGDFLQRRANGTDPDAAQQIHLRAARWNAAQNNQSQALHHAEHSGDLHLFAELLDRGCEDMIYNGGLLLICQMADRIGSEIVSRYPRILLGTAWKHIREMDFAAAARAIETAEKLAMTKEYPGKYDLALLIEHRKIMLAAAEDKFANVVDRAGKLLKKHIDIPAYLACNLYGQSIRAQRERFRFDDFDRQEALARKALTGSNLKFAYVAQQAIVGRTFFSQGRNPAAERALKFGYEQAIDFAGEASPLAALPALPLAELAYDVNDLTTARELLDVHLPVARLFCFADELLAGLTLSPRLKSVSGDFEGAMQMLDEAQSIASEVGLERLSEGVLLERITTLLRHFHVDRALLLDTDPARGTLCFKPTSTVTTVDETRAEARVRLDMARGKTVDAAVVAQKWRSFAQGRGAARSFMRWTVLHAQVAAMEGDRRLAQRSLREALVTATIGRSIRIFLDEGVRIQDLLLDAYGTGPKIDQPVDQFAYEVLAAFDQKGRARTQDVTDPVEDQDPAIDGQMTGRELEILTFVAAGLRNREIGDRLGLTEGSVKWYMQRIYDKVGTRRRSIAVERARQFGFLS